MDTLNVKLIESSNLFTSIEFFAILIAAFSLLVSIYAIYLQYRKGQIYIPPIRTFGFENLYGSEDVHRAGFICILPVVFYNSGNRQKSINDIRLAVKMDKNEYYYFNPNHFMNNLGSNKEGENEVPEVVDWIHQFVIPPKDSRIFYIEFLLNEKDAVEIIELPKIIFHIQLRVNENNKYKTYQKFEKTVNDDFLYKMATGYVVYETDKK